MLGNYSWGLEHVSRTIRDWMTAWFNGLFGTINSRTWSLLLFVFTGTVSYANLSDCPRHVSWPVTTNAAFINSTEREGERLGTDDDHQGTILRLSLALQCNVLFICCGPIILLNGHRQLYSLSPSMSQIAASRSTTGCLFVEDIPIFIWHHRGSCLGHVIPPILI